MDGSRADAKSDNGTQNSPRRGLRRCGLSFKAIRPACRAGAEGEGEMIVRSRFCVLAATTFLFLRLNSIFDSRPRPSRCKSVKTGAELLFKPMNFRRGIYSGGPQFACANMETARSGLSGPSEIAKAEHCHEKPKTDKSKKCTEAFGRPHRKALSRFAKASR